MGLIPRKASGPAHTRTIARHDLTTASTIDELLAYHGLLAPGMRPQAAAAGIDARLRGALRQMRLADTVEVIGAALAREAAGMGIGVDADTLDHADELLPTLLPTLGSVLDHDAVSVISCPVDFSGHLRLTGRLGRLDEAL